MKKFKHLSYEERVEIATLKEQGLSIRKIAGALKRHPACISYELKEKRVRGEYVPKKAQHKSYFRRYLSKQNCMKVAMDPHLCRFVEEKLKGKWSPERIAGYLKRNGHFVSTKALYKFIYSRSLDYLLFWKRNRKRGGAKKYQKALVGERNFIEFRPPLYGSGHLEADFIVSSSSSWCLLVVVDRWSRYVWIVKLPNRKHAVVARAFQRILGDMKIHSITTDNDIAFTKWRQLEELLNTKIYFTHPYCSWEKGLVENTNRWIRVFVPKKRDIATVSKKELQKIQTFLNTVPRQILHFQSASEVQLQTSKCLN